MQAVKVTPVVREQCRYPSGQGLSASRADLLVDGMAIGLCGKDARSGTTKGALTSCLPTQ